MIHRCSFALLRVCWGVLGRSVVPESIVAVQCITKLGVPFERYAIV